MHRSNLEAGSAPGQEDREGADQILGRISVQEGGGY